MRAIGVTDLLGDLWLLQLVPLRATQSDRGLIEVWYPCLCKGDTQHPWMNNYGAIPIPIFTEWWP